VRIACVIPAYNEEKPLSSLLPALQSFMRKEDTLVVDDGSRDSSSEVARRNGFRVLRNSRNLGKGMALRAGFRWAIEEDYDAVLTIDADCQHDPGSIKNLVQVLKESGVDIVIGTRSLSRSQMPPQRILSNKLTSLAVSILTQERVHDTQSGFRIIKTDVLKTVRLRTARFEMESELLINSLRQGYRLAEVPVATRYGNEESSIAGFLDTARFVLLAVKSLFWFSN
jgi:glycosyltransferase involved in cell wall biosynthesis